MFHHEISFPREFVVSYTAIHNLSVSCLRTATGFVKVPLSCKLLIGYLLAIKISGDELIALKWFFEKNYAT